MTLPPEPGSVPPQPTPPGAVPPAGGPTLDYANAAAGAAPYLGPAPDPEARTMATVAHVLGIFTFWLGPLVIWLVKKDTSPFVNDQGKEALNWEVTTSIAWIVLWVPHFFLPGFVSCFLSILILAVFVVNLIFCIMGAVAANRGVAYRYPVSLRLIS